MSAVWPDRGIFWPDAGVLRPDRGIFWPDNGVLRPDAGTFGAGDDVPESDDGAALPDSRAPVTGDGARPADCVGAADRVRAGAAVFSLPARSRCPSPSGARSASKSRKRWSGKPWLSVTVPQTRAFLPA